MRKTHLLYSTASASLMAIAATAFSVPALAQEGGDAAIEASEIVVTARRKDERLQDVPLTVNAVSAEDLSKLSIRRFEDITSVVPGLDLKPDPNGYAPTASVRGVNYDTTASGLNGTIEFYLNDAPTSAGALFQAMYDIGQVELLRGPQGTLRGRATPSGSMTISTHRVNMSQLGGYVAAAATDIGGINANGALNIPVIEDVLAIRVAGLIDENEGNRVRSVNNGAKPYSRTTSGRVSARFEPTDNLKFDFMYQKMIQNSGAYSQVMSTGTIPDLDAITPGTQYNGTITPITADDRLAVQDMLRPVRQEFHVLNWQGEWAFAGQKLNYVGSFWRQKIDTQDMAADQGDFFGANTLYTPPATPGTYSSLNGYGNITHSEARNYSHELRLSSEEPLFGKLDYIVGAFASQLTPPTRMQRATTTYNLATNSGYATYSALGRLGRSKEKSLFGNLTYHLGDATEISGGARYIYYESVGSLDVGVIIPTENAHFNAVVYTGSIKHRFNDDLMVYVSTGSSWRPGLSVTGDFNPSSVRQPNENLFTMLQPERSKSYEIGFKSSFLNKRARLNVTAYHQDFKNYPWRSGGNGVYYVAYTRAGASATQFNFVGAVPVKVNGVEVEGNFQATRNWNVGGNFSYSHSKMSNGFIPCNDYWHTANNAPGQDGIADTNGFVPSVPQILAAHGPTGCSASYRASNAPLLAANLQSEYSHSLSDNMTGYLRGMVQFVGSSQNDPTNSLDDYKSYALFNLYAGIRDPKGAWELSIYGKNITNTKRVLTKTSAALATTVGTAAQPTAYYGITTNAPREFGLNIRYAFGSR